METNFTIKNKLDKEGSDNYLPFIFEIISISGLVWIVLLIAPLFLNSKSKTLKNDKSWVNFLLEFYNHPDKYYFILTIISVSTALLYLIYNMRFKKIIEIVILKNQVKLIITNRLGTKYKRISIENKFIKAQLKTNEYKDLFGLTFYKNENKIGFFSFRNVNTLTLKEKELIEKLKTFNWLL